MTTRRKRLSFAVVIQFFFVLLCFMIICISLCKAQATYTVNVNGFNYQRGSDVEVYEGDDIFIELRVRLPNDPVPGRTYALQRVTSWSVPPCFVFVRQFTPMYNNANQYRLGPSPWSCYGSSLSIYHDSFTRDSDLERQPVTVRIVILQRCTCPSVKPPVTNARVSVNEQNDLADISIFPNPVHDYIRVNLGNSTSNESSKILIFNDKEQVVKTRDIVNDWTQNSFDRIEEIDVKDLPKGTYFIHVFQNGQTKRKHILLE